MTQYAKLIERLERATGPDRELDIAIAFAVGRIRERDGNYLYATGNDSDMVVEPSSNDDHLVAQPLSYYTDSIDAALTLKRELGYSIIEFETGNGCQAEIDGEFGDGATPPIAVCIAALKAREAMQ